jgi:acetylornithine deacetylase/succinyl-diaminopimelate desuccinylase-like protein
MHALGRSIAIFDEAAAAFTATGERTSYNVGRIGGGTSVNAIPFEAWMEVDLRSSDSAALDALDARVRQAVDQAVAEENERWGRRGGVTVTKELVGDRPAGVLPVTSPIVRAAQAAAEVLGLVAALSEGSTDANLPISLGIPAVTIGGGGAGSDAHALDETFDSRDAWRGVQHALLLTVALAHP